MAPSRISESTQMTMKEVLDETAFIPPFGVGKPHNISYERSPGRHSVLTDQDGERYAGRHRSPDQRPPLFRVTGGIALAFSIFGLVIGWLMFGVPSAMGMAAGWWVLRREGTPQPKASWAFYLGILGIFMGMMSVVAVITQ